MRNHHQLLAWQEAIELVQQVYALTSTFPASEGYGLTAQMRRAAISVPSNIAEGAARETQKEFAHFLVMARGSLSELETQLVISKKLAYCATTDELDPRMNQVFKLLGGLIKKTRAQS